jgi:hypothetical protein
MKLPLAVLVLVLYASPALQKPIPPGVRQAEQAEQQGELNLPPPSNQPVKPSLAQLQRDAGQLATLARDIPAEVDQLFKGTRPTDLEQKLKEIEKLSKRLRSDLRRRVGPLAPASRRLFLWRGRPRPRTCCRDGLPRRLGGFFHSVLATRPTPPYLCNTPSLPAPTNPCRRAC